LASQNDCQRKQTLLLEETELKGLLMALLRQHGGSLFEEEILAAYPFLSILGKPKEILVGNTMKRGSADNHPYPCKRQRRYYFLQIPATNWKSYRQ
jgi:hypothetical protein